LTICSNLAEKTAWPTSSCGYASSSTGTGLHRNQGTAGAWRDSRSRCIIPDTRDISLPHLVRHPTDRKPDVACRRLENLLQHLGYSHQCRSHDSQFARLLKSPVAQSRASDITPYPRSARQQPSCHSPTLGEADAVDMVGRCGSRKSILVTRPEPSGCNLTPCFR
jgi:hypothetical protein